MADTEHKDIYIAAAVGGVALVLVMLHVFSNQQPTATNAEGASLPLPGATTTGTPSTYNYNIAPFNPAPGIPYPKSSLATNTLPSVASPQNGGCCDQCGPSSGSGYFANSVAQYMTLIGFGNQAGAA